MTGRSGIVTNDSGQRRKSVTINRNERSRCPGIAGHVRPESLVTIARNTMPFILKTRPLPPNAAAGAEVPFEERTFFGGDDIGPEDEVFIWTSETAGGVGLAWRGTTVNVRPGFGRRIWVIVRLIEQADPEALNLANLRPYRDVDPQEPLATLARKLYRHAHNKIAGLTMAEAAFLRERF